MIMEGKIFQQKLRDLGITQAQVAEVLGITPQSVSSMMKAMSVKTSTLEKIAKGLGKDISLFFSDNESDMASMKKALDEKDERIRKLEERVKALEAQAQTKDETISRLIGIIDKKII